MSIRNLILGDVFSVIVLTFIGFATHNELDASYLPRMGVMLVSMAAGWFALAPAMGLFDAPGQGMARPLWRVALTGFFAGQLAVNLRGLLLGDEVQPVFAIVLGLTTALGMMLWRWLAGRVK